LSSHYKYASKNTGLLEKGIVSGQEMATPKAEE